MKNIIFLLVGIFLVNGNVFAGHGKFGGQTRSTISWTSDKMHNGPYSISNPTGSLHLTFSTNAYISTETKERIVIATNTYTIGYSSAAYFYGDGSNLFGTKWNGITFDPSSLVAGDLIRYDGSNFVRIASGTVEGQYLKQDFTWDTPAGAGDVLEAADNTFTGKNGFTSTTTFSGYIDSIQVPKVLALYVGSDGTLLYEIGVTSVTYVISGVTEIHFETSFSNTNFILQATSGSDGTFCSEDYATRTVDSVRITSRNDAGEAQDPAVIQISIYGSQ